MRSIFDSDSVSRPYPDLISSVVTPSASKVRTRRRDASKSSSSYAARVSRMVQGIPSPLRGLSSGATPARRCAKSRAPLPAWTRCVWQSTSPA